MKKKKGLVLKKVGTRIREWRKSKNIKSYELALLLRLSQGSLSDIENNKSLPSAGTIAAFYKYTDIDVPYMLLGKGHGA